MSRVHGEGVAINPGSEVVISPAVKAVQSARGTRER